MPKRGDNRITADVVCPTCRRRESEVIESRGTKTGKVRRRRVCACGTRFTTFEQIGRDDSALIRRRLVQALELLEELREDVEHS